MIGYRQSSFLKLLFFFFENDATLKQLTINDSIFMQK